MNKSVLKNGKRFINKMKLMVFALTLTSGLTGMSAEAHYYRFWRGTQRADLTPAQFDNLLNGKLLPVTGALFKTSVGIRSYQPVLLNRSLSQSGAYPTETALLSYENEGAYQTYRATREGQAYGALHFEMFEKSKSSSLVPEPYLGQLRIEAAYDIFGKEVDWNIGRSEFKIYSRGGKFTDAQYLSSIQSHIQHLLDSGPQAAVILIAQNYVLEYTLWHSRSALAKFERTVTVRFDPTTGRTLTKSLDDLVEVTSRTDMEIALPRGTFLRPATGIRYEP